MSMGSVKAGREGTQAIANLLHVIHTDHEAYYVIASKLSTERMRALTEVYHHMRLAASNSAMMKDKGNDRQE